MHASAWRGTLPPHFLADNNRSCGPALPPPLQRYSMADGELLLSSGTYHSPMHLISGDFWLTFPGLVRQGRGKGQTVGRQQQRAAGDGAKDAPCGGQKLPTYTCRKGFDVAKRVLVPLQRALEGWSSAA